LQFLCDNNTVGYHPGLTQAVLPDRLFV